MTMIVNLLDSLMELRMTDVNPGLELSNVLFNQYKNVAQII